LWDRKGKGTCYTQHSSQAPAGAEPEDSGGGKRVGAGTAVFDMAQQTEGKWIRGHVPLSKRESPKRPRIICRVLWSRCQFSCNVPTWTLV
jgi:hypothetical protein